MEEVILSKVCVLVTAAFLLTLVPGSGALTAHYYPCETGERPYWCSSCSASWKRPLSGKPGGSINGSLQSVQPVWLPVPWLG
jgi:hypothetical protein